MKHGGGELADELVLKQGLVWKRGRKRLSSWKRRFLVLRPSSLSYHQTSENGIHQRFLELTQSSQVVALPKKHQYALEVSTKTFPSLTIRTDTEQDFEAWKLAIEGAIRHAPCWTSIQLGLLGNAQNLIFPRFIANLTFPPKTRKIWGEREIILEVGREWVRIVVLPIPIEDVLNKRQFLHACDVVLVTTSMVEGEDVDVSFNKHLLSNTPYMLVGVGANRGTFQANLDRAKLLPGCNAYSQIDDLGNVQEIAQVFLDCVGLVMDSSSRTITPPLKPVKSAISLLPWSRKANSSSSVKLINRGEAEDEDDETTLPIKRPAVEEQDTEEDEEDEEDEDEDDDAGSMVSVEVDEEEDERARQDFGISTAKEDAQYTATRLHKHSRSSHRSINTNNLDNIEEGEDKETPTSVALPVENARRSVANFVQRHNRLVQEQLLVMRQEKQTQQRVLNEFKPIPELSFLEELKLQRTKLPSATTTTAIAEDKIVGGEFQTRTNKSNAVFF
ncbi:hypothetical protein BASA81_005495 [Batrachochytrium salamandrivorans]|nr:hypothetical protein BASA81_005495 [Batrachochytrium salamandrivorans]